MYVKRANRILSMLFEEMKGLSDDDRALPIRWNVMHMYTSSQLAKMLALKRNMDPELAALAAALHDIAVLKTKRQEGHAIAAEPYVRKAIEKYNSDTRLPKITEAEALMLVNAIKQHSDKAAYTDDPLVELLKDVDSVDRFLHGVQTEGAHLERCNKVLKEFGIEVG